MAGQNNIDNRVNTISDAVNSLIYSEIPVPIGTFLSDEEYLGKITEKGHTIYPFWRTVLSDIAVDDTRYLTVLTGAIGCLGPEVEVSLLDGRELTIPEIIKERKEGKQHWVYSYDIARKKIVPGKVIDAMLSGKNVDNIVEVEVDNKERILCTHDHPFLTTEGFYKKAEELEPGDSLLPLYRENGSNGYELIGAGKQQWQPTFRIVAEEIYGPVPKGSCVHHTNFSKEDNSPENLKVMLNKDHWQYHATLGSPFQVKPGFASECAKKANDNRWNGPGNEQQRKEASDRLKKRNEEGQSKKANDSYWQGPGNKQRREVESIRLTKRNKEKGQNIKANKTRWSKPGAGEHHSASMKEWWATRKLPTETRTCAAPGCSITFECRVDSDRKYCCSGHSGKGRRKYNHKVVSVKCWSKRIDVYDLSVEKHHNFALTSGVFVHNTGKTRTALAAVCYGMYRILCLKNPWHFYGKTGGGKMAVVFFNLTQSLSASKGYNLLQSYLMSSPWFKRRGFIVGTERNPRVEFPIFEYKLASPYAKGFGFTGEDVIFAIMDEVDSETESEKQKIRVLQAYEAAVTRFESRFVRIGAHSGKRETLGRFFLCASKQEKLSFLNTFIVKMKNSKIVRVVDAALWDVKVDLNYSGKTFPIMLGDSYIPPKILGWELESGFEVDTEGINHANKNGFEIVQIPIELLERFQKDPVGNLRRLAGISTDQLRKSKLFPSEKLIVDCYDPLKKDPVSMLTISIGLNDDVDLTKYIDFDVIRVPRHRPRYIHVDIAYSGNGDALGLGMSCISGVTDIVEEDKTAEGGMRAEKLPVVETDFGMRIKARPGDKIPLNKIRKFIGDLKTVYGFNIQLVTYDYDALSEESKQILTRFGIKCASLSLDKNPEIYRSFRTLVSEKRWCCHRNAYLHFELVNLEDDNEKNKIDHPDEVADVETLSSGDTQEIVLKGSKDVSDGVVGSVEDALRSCGDFAPKAFTEQVKRVILQPPIPKNPVNSLLQIERKSTHTKKKKDSVNTTSIQFKNIFSRSQEKHTRRKDL